MNLTLRQRLRLAIHDPGAVAGKKLGPSWPEGDHAHREEEESVSDWIHRAVCQVVWPELAPQYIYLLTWPDGDEASDLSKLGHWPGDRYFTEKDHASRTGLYGYISQELALRAEEPAPGFERQRELAQMHEKAHYRRMGGGQEWTEQLYEGDMPTGLYLRRIQLHRSTVVNPPEGD